jgi:subtilisin-like proprotein convertase family protein
MHSRPKKPSLAFDIRVRVAITSEILKTLVDLELISPGYVSVLYETDYRRYFGFRYESKIFGRQNLIYFILRVFNVTLPVGE